MSKFSRQAQAQQPLETVGFQELLKDVKPTRLRKVRIASGKVYLHLVAKDDSYAAVGISTKVDYNGNADATTLGTSLFDRVASGELSIFTGTKDLQGKVLDTPWLTIAPTATTTAEIVEFNFGKVGAAMANA